MTFRNLSQGQIRAARVSTGLECEGVRVTREGNLSSLPHPTEYGDKLANPYITTDYAEMQLECITSPHANYRDTFDQAAALRHIVQLECHKKGELLWPQSMPAPLPPDSQIPIARYGSSLRGVEAFAYREALARRYGKAQQMLSGVHFNFSYSDELIESLWSDACAAALRQGDEPAATLPTLSEFRDAAYMKAARNYVRFAWLLVYLTGATPAFHESVARDHQHDLIDLGVEVAEEGIFVLKDGISCRNGRCGYRNIEPLHPRYTSLSEYVASIESFISDGLISEAKELYSPVRLKTGPTNDPLGELEKSGIAYLEIRSIDLNPFAPAGIALHDLEFLQVFALYLLLVDEKPCDLEWQVEGDQNLLCVAEHGLRPGLTLLSCGEEVSLREWALDLLGDIESLHAHVGWDFDEALACVRRRVEEPQTTYATRFRELVEEQGFVEASIELAHEAQEKSYNSRWSTPGYEDWEMSTQLLAREAMRRGIKTQQIDHGDNLIKLTAGDRVEYVKQCTKTSADSYITPLLMNNKSVSKSMLREAGISAPNGERFSEQDTVEVLEAFVGLPAVIKPQSTNFGLGVTMFEEGAPLEHLIEAAKFAFSLDSTVLVEEFIPGLEYRFLTIGDKVAGVLHRAPAQVSGDGSSTIAQLIAEKNAHPYRSTGYRTPLVNIEMGEVEREFLARQNLGFDSVPSKGEVILLRPNSNISTGGESFDVTDEVASIFIERAIAAARVFNAHFCGVDMIIGDLKNPDSAYSIIEVNFNPAIHIHSFPAHGVEREIAPLVLQEIGFGSYIS